MGSKVSENGGGGKGKREGGREGRGVPGCPRDDDEYGRGMAIIAALADKFGHDAVPAGQVVWAEVTWLDAE